MFFGFSTVDDYEGKECLTIECSLSCEIAVAMILVLLSLVCVDQHTWVIFPISDITILAICMPYVWFLSLISCIETRKYEWIRMNTNINENMYKYLTFFFFFPQIMIKPSIPIYTAIVQLLKRLRRIVALENACLNSMMKRLFAGTVFNLNDSIILITA